MKSSSFNKTISELLVEFPSPSCQVYGHLCNVLSILRDAFQTFEGQPYGNDGLLVETKVKELVHHTFRIFLNSLSRHDRSVRHCSVDFRQGLQGILQDRASQVANLGQISNQSLWKR